MNSSLQSPASATRSLSADRNDAASPSRSSPPHNPRRVTLWARRAQARDRRYAGALAGWYARARPGMDVGRLDHSDRGPWCEHSRVVLDGVAQQTSEHDSVGQGASPIVTFAAADASSHGNPFDGRGIYVAAQSSTGKASLEICARRYINPQRCSRSQYWLTVIDLKTHRGAHIPMYASAPVPALVRFPVALALSPTGALARLQNLTAGAAVSSKLQLWATDLTPVGHSQLAVAAVIADAGSIDPSLVRFQGHRSTGPRTDTRTNSTSTDNAIRVTTGQWPTSCAPRASRCQTKSSGSRDVRDRPGASYVRTTSTPGLARSRPCLSAPLTNAISACLRSRPQPASDLQRPRIGLRTLRRPSPARARRITKLGPNQTIVLTDRRQPARAGVKRSGTSDMSRPVEN